MQRTPWIERTFNFDFPPGLFPNIMERLYGTEARIRQLLTDINNEKAESKAGLQWSVKEHIGHLADLEDLHLGRIDDFLAGKEKLRAADMSNVVTENSNHNQKSIEQLIQSFSEKRARLISRFESLNDATHAFLSLHPRLQVMVRPVDMAFFTAEHDDHHLASIRFIIKNT